HDHDVVQIEIGVLRVCLGPRRKGTDDVGAEQGHQVISLSEDHQIGRRSDPANDVRHGIGMTVKRSNARLKLCHDWPDKRLRVSLDDRILRCGSRCLRVATPCEADATPYLDRTFTGRIAPACGWRTYSITASARASSIGEMSRLSERAVCKLSTNSSLV